MDWYQGLKDNNDTEVVNLGWVKRQWGRQYKEIEITSIKGLLKVVWKPTAVEAC